MEPTRFGHYELRELIGRGGMGEVYIAYDTNTQRTVALKVLPPHLAKDPVFQERFKRESQAAAGLNDWVPAWIGGLPLAEQSLGWLLPVLAMLLVAVLVDRLLGRPRVVCLG